MTFKPTKFMRRMAAHTGLPFNVWAHQVLSAQALKIEGTIHHALIDEGHRDEEELMLRRREREFNKHHPGRGKAIVVTQSGNNGPFCIPRGLNMVLAQLQRDTTPRGQLAEDYRETYFHKFDKNPDIDDTDQDILAWHDAGEQAFDELQETGDAEPEENRESFVTAFVLFKMVHG